MYDVCIVGAGIAGSALAYNLCPSLKTCVIEKAEMSGLGKKPCGDAVHAWWFKGGIEPKPERLNAVLQRIRRIELNLKVEKFSKELSGEREGIMIDRHKFVTGALERALDEGCELIRAEARPKFRGDNLLHVEANGRKIEAEVYVDASGVRAVLRSHFLPNRGRVFFLGYREIIKHELDDASWRTYLFGPDEAYWVFSRGQTTNVGVAVFSNSKESPRERLSDFKKFLGLENEEVVDRGSALIPSNKPIDLVYGKVVAIGDAGFTVNPLSGGGIGPSVYAANLLAECLRGNEGLEEFNRRYRSSVGRDYEGFYRISRVLLWTRKIAWRWALRRAFMKFY